MENQYQSVSWSLVFKKVSLKCVEMTMLYSYVIPCFVIAGSASQRSALSLSDWISWMAKVLVVCRSFSHYSENGFVEIS